MRLQAQFGAERRREAAMRPLEAPHSLVIYDLCRPVEPTR